MAHTGFIPDGYTMNGVIRSKPNVHESVHLTYRPATIEERGELFDRWEKLSPSLRLERGSKFLVDHITVWDLKDPDGNPVKLSAENCARLTFDLYGSLLNLICVVSDDQEGDEKN